MTACLARNSGTESGRRTQRMAANDWAIVVGIRVYPDLTNLDGPENDANAMYAWLTAPHGGAVPVDQTALILSSQFPPPLDGIHAEPTPIDILNAFENLQEVADHNSDAGNGRKVGRRLYIYMSGHGCAPRPKDAALLTANASRVRVGYHVLGRLIADWYLQSNFFDEAVLVMDCCRESYPQAPPAIPPWIDINGVKALDDARAFCAFGTKWSRLARERVMDDGLVHGVFTWTLLQGLKTAADASHCVTAETLGDYLYNNMKTFLKPEDLADPEVPKEPDIDYDKNPARPRFVFCTLPAPSPAPAAPAPQFPVTIAIPPEAAGKTVRVLGGKFQEVRRAPAVPPSWPTTLECGTYVAQILEMGRQSDVFTVDGTGAVNVAL